MNITIVVGTRPQIIKSAPLIHLLNEDTKINLNVIHTGQHYDYRMTQIRPRRKQDGIDCCTFRGWS